MIFGPSLDSAVALIVGASGGIGGGQVERLLADRRFAQVYGTYHHPDRAENLLALAQSTPALTALPLDVTDETSLEQAIATLQAQTPRLHLVVYCVGVLHQGAWQPEKSLRQLNPEWMLRSFQVNALGAALVAKHLLPLLKHDQPSVLAALSAKVGSIGDNRLGGWYGYRASKAALNMLFKTTSLEYARKSPHTTVVLLHPGTTDTGLSEPFQRGVPPAQLFSIERTTGQLMAIIDGLTPAATGTFFNWDGRPLPW